MSKNQQKTTSLNLHVFQGKDEKIKKLKNLKKFRKFSDF